MERIKEFRIQEVPHHAIAFAVTDLGDYDGHRVLIAENWPKYRDYTVIDGAHCSCFGFDEVEWSAITYNETELKTLVSGWVERGYPNERIIAPLVLEHLGSK